MDRKKFTDFMDCIASPMVPVQLFIINTCEMGLKIVIDKQE
jgi:hypothetical protein